MSVNGKIFAIFVMLDPYAGALNRSQRYGQFFCSQRYGGDVLPCPVCDGPDDPGKGSSNGKGITVFYLMSAMLKNLPI